MLDDKHLATEAAPDLWEVMEEEKEAEELAEELENVEQVDVVAVLDALGDTIPLHIGPRDCFALYHMTHFERAECKRICALIILVHMHMS